MRSLIIACLLIITCSPAAIAAHSHLEKEYQTAWCAQHDGITEVVLTDQARVDCVTETHAVEVDFAAKWAESVGQALYYGLKTKLQPGVLLILERKSDVRFLPRLEAVADKYGITVWTITPGEL